MRSKLYKGLIFRVYLICKSKRTENVSLFPTIWKGPKNCIKNRGWYGWVPMGLITPFDLRTSPALLPPLVSNELSACDWVERLLPPFCHLFLMSPSYLLSNNYCLTRILQPAEKDDEKVRKRESHVVSKRLLDQLLSRELHHHRRSSAKAEWRRKNMHIIKCAQKSQKPSKKLWRGEKKSESPLKCL